MQSIYDRIELLIDRNGMTKKAFCEKLGISTGNLGDWKRGKTTPGTHKLIEIGAFFGVSLDWLILGKMPSSTVREGGVDYFLDSMRQSNCQLEAEEEAFIREYLAFAAYRKTRQEDKEENH
ncbi:helix-turn-helix domain-containing protein [Paenibacillus glufosinatiresistens]|uniref:helix-turn-helix domain-containing protein n=1 Tax=Paenibacillus glufosinatiresistens TaxID=3070657 RepID=UPI00286E5B80|nr:helix-turn-helix transcriptional regulator [Paenibacillus sp. YX.27]